MVLRRRRHPEQRGSVAVEFALITPVLVLFFVGIIELGLLMKDNVSMASAVRAGARTAAASADAGPGTCEASGPNPPPCTPARAPMLAQAAADQIQKVGVAMPTDDIDWLRIYRAGPNGFPVGGNSVNHCATDCVTYVWDRGLNKFRYQSGAWDSKSINACVNHVDRMTVGVAMQVSHRWIMGFSDTPKVLHERTIMQFEPLEADRCMPNTHG